MKIAIFGGTFNPLHLGHALLADTLTKDLGFDKVLIIPTATPPHKIINSKISAEVRLDMIKSFCKEHNSDPASCGIFVAEPCEIDRGGVSYTCDTVREIQKKYGDDLTGKLSLVMGQETASQFHKWREAAFIASTCDLLIARRHPDHSSIDTAAFQNKATGDYSSDFAEIEAASSKIDETLPYPHKMLENPLLPISSTQIRSRIATNLAFRYLLPPAVYRYIIDHHLYKD